MKNLFLTKFVDVFNFSGHFVTLMKHFIFIFILRYFVFIPSINVFLRLFSKIYLLAIFIRKHQTSAYCSNGRRIRWTQRYTFEFNFYFKHNIELLLTKTEKKIFQPSTTTERKCIQNRKTIKIFLRLIRIRT